MKPDQPHSIRSEDTDSADHAELLHALAAALDPIEPPPARQHAMRQRLRARVADSATRHAELRIHRATQGEWQHFKAGVAMKLLNRGPSGNSVLVRLTAGAHLPVHRHRWAEEGIVLDGALYLNGHMLARGDYHLSLPGSRHERITAPQGGIVFLRGASLGDRWAMVEVLTGWLPYRGAPAVTQHVGEGLWTEIAPGVQQHILRPDGACHSRLIRMAPGTRLSRRDHDRDEECMVIEGDVFFGDVLMRAGDYHLAPAGSRHGLVESDTGALFFVHGAAESWHSVASGSAAGR